ncbi:MULTISPECIES: hypothetical protein [Acidiphilium]|nr:MULTISPECIES: hypothetical protein [Acidiphilium]
MIARIKANAQRYANTGALFQALDGGWGNCDGDAKNVKTCWEALP